MHKLIIYNEYMAEIQIQRIKSIYGEVKGILREMPSEAPGRALRWPIAEHYNFAVDDLSQVAGTNYDRFKIEHDSKMNEHYTNISMARTKAGALISRLEQEYGFDDIPKEKTAPIVVTVQQNQTLNVNVTPIQQLMESTMDDELRTLLEELRDSLETQQNVAKTKGILKNLMEKSWELFVKVLPYVLENIGK